MLSIVIPGIYNYYSTQQKSSKGRKLFGKLGASKDEHEDTKRKGNDNMSTY